MIWQLWTTPPNMIWQLFQMIWQLWTSLGGRPKSDLATLPNDLAPPNEENGLPNIAHFGGIFAYIKGILRNNVKFQFWKTFWRTIWRSILEEFWKTFGGV